MADSTVFSATPATIQGEIVVDLNTASPVFRTIDLGNFSLYNPNNYGSTNAVTAQVQVPAGRYRAELRARFQSTISGENIQYFQFALRVGANDLPFGYIRQNGGQDSGLVGLNEFTTSSAIVVVPRARAYVTSGNSGRSAIDLVDFFYTLIKIA